MPLKCDNDHLSYNGQYNHLSEQTMYPWKLILTLLWSEKWIASKCDYVLFCGNHYYEVPYHIYLANCSTGFWKWRSVSWENVSQTASLHHSRLPRCYRLPWDSCLPPSSLPSMPRPRLWSPSSSSVLSSVCQKCHNNIRTNWRQILMVLTWPKVQVYITNECNDNGGQYIDMILKFTTV